MIRSEFKMIRSDSYNTTLCSSGEKDKKVATFINS